MTYQWILVKKTTGFVSAWNISTDKPPCKEDDIFEWVSWEKTLPDSFFVDFSCYYSDGNLYAESDFSGDALTCYTQAELDTMESE